MRIVRVFNNNVVATITEDKKEAIVTGAGVGFGKKAGDFIDEKKITQKFFIQNERKKKFYSVLERTPIEYFEISEGILEYAEKKLRKPVNDSILISLTDHIAFAIERTKSEMVIPNLILNETQALYRKEFAIGIWALNYIEEKTKVRFAEDEAGYIAIHIIDATNTAPDNDAIKMIDSVKKVIEIIEDTYNIKTAKESLDYFRLVTHLKFFIQRISQNEEGKHSFIQEIYNNLAKKDKKIVRCIDKIVSYIEAKYNYLANQSEKVYLMIHILKIIKNE